MFSLFLSGLLFVALGSTFSYLGDYIVEDAPGEGGWQFVKCVDVDGKVRYGLYVVKPYFFNPKYAFVIRWASRFNLKMLVQWICQKGL